MPFVIVGAAIGIGLFLVVFGGRTSREDEHTSVLGGAAFTPEPLLVNGDEQRAWNFLRRVELGQEHLVFAKVRLRDILAVKVRDSRKWMSVTNRIRDRHVDFLLTDTAFKPLLVVEVDGASHRTRRASESDAIKDAVFHRAGLDILRLRTDADWNQEFDRWRRRDISNG